jgi:serine/threonine protein kinase
MPDWGDNSGPPAEDSSNTPGVNARYLRTGLLGKGGMGVVYLAYDQQLSRPIALKEAAQEGALSERLAREAQLTATLDHPNIVTVHDSGTTEDGRPFYTMRLLTGRALSAVIAEKSTMEERLSLLRHYLDACHAVAYAHTQGVIHRDLKPANIMIGGFGETQVVDWGLAIESLDFSTAPEAIMGTPAYMSPEQARGEPASFASDVWSLGAILYELLTGTPPRGNGSTEEILDRARKGEVLPFKNLPPELVAIASRALHPSPLNRYPTATALAEDVAAWLDGRRVAAYSYSAYALLLRLIRLWKTPLIIASIAVFIIVSLVAVGTWRLAAERDRVVAAEQQTRSALIASDKNLAMALLSEARDALTAGSAGAAAVLASRSLTLEDSPEAWGILAGASMEAHAEKVLETPSPSCMMLKILAVDDIICLESDRVYRLKTGTRLWEWKGQATRLHLLEGMLLAGAGTHPTTGSGDRHCSS